MKVMGKYFQIFSHHQSGDGPAARGTMHYKSAIETATDLQERQRNLQRYKSARFHELERQTAREHVHKPSSVLPSKTAQAQVHFAKPIHGPLAPAHQPASQVNSSAYISLASDPLSHFVPTAKAVAKKRPVQMNFDLTADDQDELATDAGFTGKADSGTSKAAAAQKKLPQQKSATGAKASRLTSPGPTTPKPKATRKPRTPKTPKVTSDTKDTSDILSGLPGPVRRRLMTENVQVVVPAIGGPIKKRRSGRPRRDATVQDGSGTSLNGPITGKATTAPVVADPIRDGLSGIDIIDFQYHQRLPTPEPQATPTPDTNIAKSKDTQQLLTPTDTPDGSNAPKRRVEVEANSNTPAKRQRIFREQPIQPKVNPGDSGNTNDVEKDIQDGVVQNAEINVGNSERPTIGADLDKVTEIIEGATEKQDEDVLLLVHPDEQDVASDVIVARVF